MKQVQDISTRHKVIALENYMREQPQVEIPVQHYFSQGVYAREIFIPKGTILTGKIHKFQQLNILAAGEMDVLVGDEVKRVKAPFTVVSAPGTKRIAKAIEDCVWITIHGTDETDLDKIEQYFIAETEDEYLTFCEQLKLAGH